ncbi:hypothetical protein [Paenisporosarcina sp. TG-14]|uniref:hypothetical protein n=1 Tax=Paenisporosarcina sp. TG-14 TaxID=1231057 RepID=UPI0002DD18FE|nr:hypothetical protein [Paenisporosarcina sp. TG-14]
MRTNVHIIMGLNEDSIGLVNELKQRPNDIVYICGDIDEGFEECEEFEGLTYIGKVFIDVLDHILCKVYIYERPYKTGKHFKGIKRFLLERKRSIEEE